MTKRDGERGLGLPDGGVEGTPEDRIEAEVDEEIRLHLERRAADLRAEGYGAEEAWREAIHRFGDVERTRVVCVEADRRWEAKMRWRTRVDEWQMNLATAWRALRHRPGFTVSAALTLALGIGIATVMFSAADHILFRPLPFSQADRVATIWVTDPETGEDRIPVQPGDFIEWTRRASAFESMALVEPFGFDMSLKDRAVSIPAWLVTPGFFETVGVAPRLGRTFEPNDQAPGAAPVVIVTDGFWKRHLGGDPGIVGSSIQIDGRPTTVVGVLPEVSHLWPSKREIWAPKPFRTNELQEYGRGYMYAVGRLVEGGTLARAQQDMDRVDRDLDEVRSASAELGVQVIGLEDHILGDVRPALLILLGAVGLLLLVACANVAGLLLARGAQRSEDLAVRAALGAGRGRLFTELFTESVLLAAVGGGLGVALSFGGVELLRRFIPPELPRAAEITLDPRVLVFAVVATVGTAVLCGLLPALRFSRTRAMSAIGTGGSRGATEGPGRNRLRRGLVLLEVAAAMVLMVGGGLLARSYAGLLQSELGFEWERVAGTQAFIWDRNETPEERRTTALQVLQQIRAIPGVTSAGIATAPPFTPNRIDATNSAVREGVPPDEAPVVYTTVADSGYFPTLSIPILAGRSFTSADHLEAERVTLINETAARLLFGEEDPIGQTLTFGVMSAPASWRIIGIVGDVRPETFDSPTQPEVFIPFRQSGAGSITWLAKAQDPEAIVPALQAAVWEVDSGQSISWALTMESVIGDILAERRFQLVLLAVFGGLSLLLAAIGLFGLITFSAQQRTREVGIRVALGAQRGEIVGMVLKEGLTLALAGVVIGALGALMLSRALGGLLYGIEAADPVTYLALGTLMVGVSALASYLPARRAANRDPVKALRVE